MYVSLVPQLVRALDADARQEFPCFVRAQLRLTTAVRWRVVPGLSRDDCICFTPLDYTISLTTFMARVDRDDGLANMSRLQNEVDSRSCRSA